MANFEILTKLVGNSVNIYYPKHSRTDILISSKNKAHFAKYYVLDIHSNNLNKSTPLKKKKTKTGLQIFKRVFCLCFISVYRYFQIFQDVLKALKTNRKFR